MCDFIKARIGSFVVISNKECVDKMHENDFWIGRILHKTGGAREPAENSLFQILNIDTGEIKIINANLIIKILKY